MFMDERRPFVPPYSDFGLLLRLGCSPVRVNGHKKGDNVTLMDLDENGITDLDEIDPRNSATRAVRDFWNYSTYVLKDDSMLKDQFNQFIRENA